MRDAIIDTYDRLAAGVTPSQGFDGAPVRKVKVEDIKNELKRGGAFVLDEKGCMTGGSRNAFCEARNVLTDRGGQFREEDGLFWRILPSYDRASPR